MHKRSIFSSRFDKERQTKDLQWLHAFNKSKLFPKISESSFRKPSHKPMTANKPIRKRLLNSNEWYDSDKISFTDRYFMEQRLNITLLEKSKCESIAVLRSKDDVCDNIGNQSRRNSIKFHGTLQDIDKIKILENVLKIEVLEETLNEINIKKIMESPSKQSSIRLSIISSDGKHVCFYCDKRFNVPGSYQITFNCTPVSSNFNVRSATMHLQTYRIYELINAAKDITTGDFLVRNAQSHFTTLNYWTAIPYMHVVVI